MLDGHVEVRDGDRLVVSGSDAASLNARLVAAGLRVTELAPERRTLEDVIVEVTSPEAAR
jgi:ABC-2 type transport system ATP-binding protein